MENQSTQCNDHSLHHELTVRLLHASLVKPSKPTKQHVMYMSAVDQPLRKASPSRTLLFYKTSKNPVDAIETLRLGIASALVQYYPMAGRLLQQGGRLAINCNDEGVQFTQAHCELPFADLERNSYDIRPLFRQLVPMDDREYSDHLDDPLASFQVTTFKGGLTVGIAVLHSVADGYAMWSFIQAVSQACRGEPLSASPLHARILLKPEVFMMGTSFPDDDLLRSDVAPYTYCEDAIREHKPTPESLHQKVIHFSKEMLESLKEACLLSTIKIDAAKPGFFISTYQALAAYLWKRLTMAQCLTDDDCVDLRTAVDVRSRMIPPLTPAYFGNAVVGISTPTTAKEVLSESLGETAARLQKRIQQVDDTYIKRAIIARESMDLLRVGSSRVKVMGVRNASGFRVYKAGDFGWGEPEAVRPPWSRKEGQFTWYSGKHANSIDVTVGLSDATYANFFSSELYPNDPLYSYLFPASN